MKRIHSESFKLQVVLEYLEGLECLASVARKYQLDRAMLRRWVERYRQQGRTGLRPATKHHYTRAFKLKVLEQVQKQGLTDRQAEAIFNLRTAGLIRKWLEQYHEGELTNSVRKREGPGPMAQKRVSPPQEEPSGQEPSREELLEELAYLRAENDYLKKLDALIREEQAAARGKKRKRSKG